MANIDRRNVTVSLKVETIQKAKVLAAKRSTSISGLLAAQIEALVSDEDRFERAASSAIVRMERGLHLGGRRPVSRDELHGCYQSVSKRLRDLASG